MPRKRKSEVGRYRRQPGRKQYIIDRVDKLRRTRLITLMQERGSRCQSPDCGYNRCTAALEFHHRDPEAKLFNVNMMTMTNSWSAIVAEVAKCDLLCANCHREHHAPDWTFGEVAERLLRRPAKA